MDGDCQRATGHGLLPHTSMTSDGWRRSALGRGGALLARLFMLACCLAAGAGGGSDNDTTTDGELPKGARYGVFMFPPPGMCFPDSAAARLCVGRGLGLGVRIIRV